MSRNDSEWEACIELWTGVLAISARNEYERSAVRVIARPGAGDTDFGVQFRYAFEARTLGRRIRSCILDLSV